MLLNEAIIKKYVEQSLKELFIDSYNQRVKIIKDNDMSIVKSFHGAHNQIFGKDLSFGFFFGGTKKEVTKFCNEFKQVLGINCSNEELMCETLNMFSGLFLRRIQMKDPTTIINIPYYIEDTLLESTKWEDYLEVDIFKKDTLKIIYFRI